MDGLIAYILQELAYECDLGSDVSRLRQIISQYYATHPLTSKQAQTIDDRFCAFVWNVLATQDHVVVGVAPDGAAAVYFPPQPSKAKAAGKGKSKAQPVSISLSPLAPDEVASQSLSALITKYGNGLRIAVEPDICFVCLTGSHIRPPKLSANAYAVLQLITRTRAEGISVADVSRQSGYDPKTCFYFIKILVDFGHIHKIKVGGAAVNICVHKSFFEQCPWRLPARETTEADHDAGADAEEDEEDEEADGVDKEFTTNIQFEPIDNRHMSNVTVIKTRIEQLLRHMPNGLHVYRHLLEAIGFRSTLKRERRIFTHRVHELFKNCFIEKVWAQSNTSSTGRVLCIRLVNSDLTTDTPGQINSDERDGATMDATLINEGENRNGFDSGALAQFEGVHATQSIAAQIISLVEQSDITGMTLADIAKCLHDFDPRSITKLAATFTSGQPPTHLSHRALVIVTEMYGRERRQRLFTLAAYRQMIEREGLEDQSVLDLEGSGMWALFDPSNFTENEEERAEWLEDFVRKALNGGGKTRAKRAKQGLAVNPLDDNGLPIKGRPKAKQTPGKASRRTGPTKRKGQDAGEGDLDQQPAMKKRRRSSRAKATEQPPVGVADDGPSTSNVTPILKPRAKPRMRKLVETGPIHAPHQGVTGPGPEDRPDNEPVSTTRHDGTEHASVNPANATLQKDIAERSKHSNSPQPDENLGPRRAYHSTSLNLASTSAHPSKRPRLAGNDPQPNTALDNSAQSAEPVHPEPTHTILTLAMPPVITASTVQPSLDGLISVQGQSRNTSPTIEETISRPSATSGQHPEEVVVSESSAQPVLRPGKTTNVSALRRQTEFLQLLENKGGAINVSLLKAFNEEHQRLLQTLHATGKTVSTTPGTGMDKRTFNATILSLEARGLVKTLVVSALTAHGTTRRANLVYLTSASQESIDKCVEEFRTSGSSKNVPLPSNFPEVEDVSYSANDAGPKHTPSPRSAPAPLPLDSLSAARETYLSEIQTAAQDVGYMIGHFARARVLYLCLLSETCSEIPPTSLVSPSEKIFSRKYLFEDIPISTYCATIPQHAVIPGLKAMLETETGRATRIHAAPETIQRSLRHRSSANRSRMHKLLSSLISLGCLVPVNVEFDANMSTTTYADVSDFEGHWEYMRLTAIVPIYRFADKDLEAPLSSYHEVRAYNDGVRLWEQLQSASQTSTYRNFEISASGTQFSGNPKLLRGIRRKGAWTDAYALSASQIDYLYDLVDATTGATPLDDESSTRFDNACFVTTAPVDVVSEFFSRTRADIQRGLERVQALAEQKARKLKKVNEEARHTLAIKAAQAKKDQDARWDSLVSNALDGRDLSRPQFQKALVSLKAEFTISSQQVSSSPWETRIEQAYRDALGAKQFVIAPPASVQPAPPQPSPPPPPPPPQSAPIVRKSQEELDPSVSKLILQQGAPVRQKKDVAPKKSGRKSKKELEQAAVAEKEDVPLQESEARRRRFPWNADYDELARDAAAIIRVRCRTKRMDWSAIEQVFPGVQRNSVRQRVSNLQALPGASEYFRSLDDAWATLWFEHRGSDALPDSNPDSVTEFDLPTHVSFLRQNIDKAALHAGAKPLISQVLASPHILDNVERILAEYDVKQNDLASQPNSWDFFFDTPSEERREREFLQYPFVVCDIETIPKAVPLNISVTQGAVKMTISTPDAFYNSDDAAVTLTLLGDQIVKLAMQGMGETIVRKQAKLGRTYPLRQYTYSDFASYRIKGDFTGAMYADATAMREHLEGLGDDEWRSIDLIDENGETALEIAVDTAIPAAGRNQLGWQNDENLESQISIRLEDMTPEPLPNAFNAGQDIPPCPSLESGPCPHTSENDINCSHCLEEIEHRISSSDQLAILAALREAQVDGVPVEQILYELCNGDLAAATIAITTLIQTRPPLAYLVGYDQARIISASVLPDWTIQVVQPPSANNENTFKMLFPRQWMSIHGNVLDDIWISVTRAVAGSLVFRPTMSEHALRKRYQGVFDRQELNDILRYLLTTKKLKRNTEFDLPVGMLDSQMEKTTYWLLADGSTWF